MKQMWMEALGKRLDKVINQYKYPSLTSDVLTPEISVKWRSILSGLPQSEEAFKELIMRRLLKSTIEEIEDLADCLIFSLSMRHKGERYLVQLQLKDLSWHIQSIQFVEQAQNTRLIRGVWITLAFVLIVSAGFLTQQLLSHSSVQQTENENQTDETADSEIKWNDELFTAHLEAIEASAQRNGYILMSEEAFEKKIKDRVNQTLANSIEEKLKSDPVQQDIEDAKENNQSVKITIKSGSPTSEVVKLLAEKNLIRSEQEALQLLKALHLDNRIRAGTYTIQRDATYMEIFNMITN